MIAKVFKIICAALFLAGAAQCHAEEKKDLLLGAGDSIHIAVFRNQDLTLDTRIAENGKISYPLVGSVQVGGLTVSEAEARIAKALKDGGFVQDPQVNIAISTMRANLVSVLGQVNKPGVFPLDAANLRVSEVLAIAGGVASSGGDHLVVKGVRDGKPFRKEIDLAAIFLDGREEDDIFVAGRDEIYVPLAPIFYIYGEVQKPGSGIMFRGMTVLQALAQGGGLTPRGTERNIELRRKSGAGSEVQVLHPAMSDRLQANDVIYVHESLF